VGALPSWRWDALGSDDPFRIAPSTRTPRHPHPAHTRSIRVNGADCGVEAILLGAVTSIGGFLFGYDTGQISSMLLFRDFIDRFATGTNPQTGEAEWVPIIQSTMVSLMSIGTLIGALSGA